MGDPRIIWITGGGTGIGRATAEIFAERGWTVAISARSEDNLNDVTLHSGNGNIHAYPLDITDRRAVTDCINEIERELGPIEIAVLNAGTYVPTPATAFDPKNFRDLFGVNVFGTVNCLAAVLSAFQHRQSGHVAVVSSVAGYRGLPIASAYGAIKAALINMCESLKPELDLMNIKLQLINPGFVETPLTAKNTFPMPYLIPAKNAAEQIYNGLQSDKFEITFPWQFSVWMKILRVVPNRVLFFLTRKMLK